MDKKISYLGDGLYAEFDGEYIWLTTHSDRVALDISVYSALLNFAKKNGWTKEDC